MRACLRACVARRVAGAIQPGRIALVAIFSMLCTRQYSCHCVGHLGLAAQREAAHALVMPAVQPAGARGRAGFHALRGWDRRHAASVAALRAWPQAEIEFRVRRHCTPITYLLLCACGLSNRVLQRRRRGRNPRASRHTCGSVRRPDTSNDGGGRKPGTTAHGALRRWAV